MRRLSMREAVNEALHIAFNSDPNVFSIGEDIATYGGQLRCSYDLLDHFGPERVRDTPISETAIIGAGIGSAMIGKRPIVELSYIDFIGVCFDQIMNQAAKMRYMYGGRVQIPLVIRTQCGAGAGNAAQHSQCLEGILAQVPGIKVVMPSNAYDAKGLLLRAVRDNNPVVFIEHKKLYKAKCEVPEEPYECNFCAEVKRPGTDISIFCYSAMVNVALKAAEELEAEGIRAEVVDVRSIAPLDVDTLVKSVRKTHYAVVVQEACQQAGIAGEIISRVQEQAFDALKSPIFRVAAPNVPVPFAVGLEAAYLPDAARVVDAVRKTLKREKG